MATNPKKNITPIKRISDIDISTAEAVLREAMTFIVPDDQSQRRAFVALMPFLYVLRNKGCSWTQLTALINDCGFDLQPASVRAYYSEMLTERQDMCQERLNEQILLLAEVRKMTSGVDLASISARTSAIMEKQRLAAASKIDNLFGVIPVNKTSSFPEATVVKPVLPGNLQPSPRPALPFTDNPDSFGLLNLKPDGVKVSPNEPSFLIHGDSSRLTPNLQFSNQTSENKKTGLRPAPSIQVNNSSLNKVRLFCLALTDGPPKLSERTNVPSEVYESGELEHPKIPGLWLSLEERVYGAALEYSDENGEVRTETPDEKRFRVLWKLPVKVSPTMTSSSFTPVNKALFK